MNMLSLSCRFIVVMAVMLWSANIRGIEAGGKCLNRAISNVSLCTSGFLMVRPTFTDTRLLLVTVATDVTDGYVRFMKSVEHFGLDVKVSYNVDM